jgi:hypothetical protein
MRWVEFEIAADPVRAVGIDPFHSASVETQRCARFAPLTLTMSAADRGHSLQAAAMVRPVARRFRPLAIP